MDVFFVWRPTQKSAHWGLDPHTETLRGLLPVYIASLSARSGGRTHIPFETRF